MPVKKLFLTLTLFLVASVTRAGIIPVSDVDASSTFSTYDVVNLVNGAGLSGNLHSGDWENKWITNATVTGTLTFDLGSIFDVASTSIWNYGGGCCGVGRSVKDLDIEASLDGVAYFSVGDFVLGQSAVSIIPSQTLALNTTARYFRFNLNSNYGAGRAGLSEVQFNGVSSSVPEPASIALLSLGLAGLLFSRKKKYS